MEGREVVGFAAEQVDDFHRRAKGGERIDLEDVERLEALEAGIGILVEQGFEHGAGLVAVAGEDVATAHLGHALAAGARRPVKGHVADQVEGIVVGTDLLGQFVKEDAARGQLFDHGLFALGRVPGAEEVVQGGVGLVHGLARVVLERFGDQPAVAVQVLDPLGGDADLDVIDHVGDGPGSGRLAGGEGWRLFFHVIRHLLGRQGRIVRAGFVDLHRFAVKGGIGKEGGGPLEVHDGEVELAVLLVDAGAAADDLLELGHGVDALVEHDQVAGLGVHPGGHELRGGGDHRIGRFRVDEVVELGLALVVVAGDAHHVPGVGGGKVGVGVDQGLAHALGVVDVLAEDDGLVIAVGGLEQLADLVGDQGGALLEDEAAVVIEFVVLAVFDHLAVLVGLADLGPPAVEVLVDADADDLVGGEEAVGNALAQRIGVNRLAEVVDVGDLAGLLGGGGEADLGGGVEIFEDLAPGGVNRGAAPVALVDHDQIEELGRELFVDVLFLLGAADRLVEGEVDLEGLVRGAVGDLGHGRAERLEIVVPGLVGEDVAVDQEEDAPPGAGLPQPPDDLKGGVGLAGAGGHDQEDAVLAPGDGVDGAVDGDELVVARALAGTVVVIVLGGDRLLGRGVAFGGAEPLPEFGRAGEPVQGNFPLDRRGGAGAVVFEKAVTV